MFSGFMKGLLTGGILGVFFGGKNLMKPPKKKMISKRLKGKTKMIQSKAGKVMEDVMKDVNDLLK
jgi:hypothetical protein